MKLYRIILTAGLAITLAAALCDCGGSGGSDKFVFLGPVDTGPDYSVVYDRAQVDEYELVFTAANWQSLQAATHTYAPGTLKFGSETYENVGIRYKGNSSFGCVPFPKKPFKIDFDRYVDGQKFHGVKKLNFHNSLWDPTMMREPLGYDAFADAGCPAGRSSHIKLFVTVPGVYDREFFGVYVSVEQVDKVYLKDRFGENDGNHYKAAMWGADLKYYGSNPIEYYDRYAKKTNELANDWSDLIHFLDVLNNTPDNAFKTEIEKVFNVDGFLSYLVANTVLSSLDSIAGRNCNFYLYHNLATGKFEFLPWDLNEVFGNHTLPRDNGVIADEMLTIDIFNPTSTGEHVLIERILNVPEYMTDYLARMRTLVNGDFSPAVMHARIDAMYNLIKADVYLDTYKEFPSPDFDAGIIQDLPDDGSPERILGLKPFITDRAANILTQLGP
ncbi:MAG: hypothetical protein E3J72_02415 [Planctomycetota bacterium]|nr:MAG: hypothetical protein E3J72_02415 [Planctomycetota bacterium]